jgi:NAD(P)-dependent dehydrogenase (short-subunit alcohol dehydrogenase family)
MKAIVIGGTGTIGSAVVKVFEDTGFEVLAVSRNSQLKADIENEESLDNLFRQSGNIDAIVCAAGNAAFGELEKLSDRDFSLSINSKLMGQVKLLQKGLHFLNPGGTVLLTGGIFAYKPWPGSSAIAMVNSALEGFVRAAALEISDNKKVMVIHPPLVAETAAKMGMDALPFPPASEVAQSYLEAVSKGKNGDALFVNGHKP